LEAVVVVVEVRAAATKIQFVAAPLRSVEEEPEEAEEEGEALAEEKPSSREACADQALPPRQSLHELIMAHPLTLVRLQSLLWVWGEEEEEGGTNDAWALFLLLAFKKASVHIMILQIIMI